MKRLFALLIATLLLAGCRDKENQCRGVTPWASTEISWTDYNSVSDARNYFYCHDSTIMEHYKDTVLVCAYLYPLGGNINSQYYYLVDDTNIVDEDHRITAGNYHEAVDLTKKYNLVCQLWSLEPKFYQVRHGFRGADPLYTHCCPWIYHLEIISMTIAE